PLQRVVARGGEDSALGNSAAPVPRAANPLQSYRDGARRADLNNQIDRADVDSEFERCRRDQNFNLSVFELLLRGQAQLAGQTSMMRGNVVFTQPLCQMMRHALDQSARINEHQRRSILLNQSDQAIVNFFPHFVRGNWSKLAALHLDREIERPLEHGTLLVHERVAGTNRSANLRHKQPALAGHLQDFPERPLKVLVNIVSESFERRNV